MLVIRGTDIRLELVLGASGKAEKLILHQNGKDMPAPREPDGAPPAP